MVSSSAVLTLTDLHSSDRLTERTFTEDFEGKSFCLKTWTENIKNTFLKSARSNIQVLRKRNRKSCHLFQQHLYLCWRQLGVRLHVRRHPKNITCWQTLNRLHQTLNISNTKNLFRYILSERMC